MNLLRMLPLYIMLALFSGAALLYFQWPFYGQALFLAIVSVPILFVVSRKWIPLLMLCVLIISISYAWQYPDAALTSIGTYFLLAVFQFSLSMVSDKVKQAAEETVQLKEQHQILMCRDGDLRALDLQEFVEQALWMLKTKRHKECAWFMEVVPATESPALIGELERAALAAISRQRDLVTSKRDAVYLLVKDNGERNLQVLMDRLEETMQKNEWSGYEVRKTRITEVSEMRSLLS